MGAVYNLYNTSMKAFTVTGFKGDAVNVFGDNISISEVVIDDSLGEDVSLLKEHHRDGIQIIPKAVRTKNGSMVEVPRAQFAGGILSGLTVEKCYITSKGSLQGIFNSDGLLENVVVTDNVISVRSQHFVTLSGLLSGTIDRNYSNKSGLSIPAPVLLTPMRIGGNIGDGNLWVSSFSCGKYKYAPLNEITSAADLSHISDLRSVINKKDTYLYDFDLESYWEHVRSLTAPRDVKEHCNLLKETAFLYGRKV